MELGFVWIGFPVNLALQWREGTNGDKPVGELRNDTAGLPHYLKLIAKNRQTINNFFF